VCALSVGSALLLCCVQLSVEHYTCFSVNIRESRFSSLPPYPTCMYTSAAWKLNIAITLMAKRCVLEKILTGRNQNAPRANFPISLTTLKMLHFQSWMGLLQCSACKRLLKLKIICRRNSVEIENYLKSNEV
jgi:hypothetical protein